MQGYVQVIGSVVRLGLPEVRRQERLHLESAVESAASKLESKRSKGNTADNPRSPQAEGSTAAAAEEKSAAKVATMARELWKNAETLMLRVRPHLSAGVQVVPVAADVSSASSDGRKSENPAAEAPPLDAHSFFVKSAARGEQCCADCSIPDADWATLSYGAYLCVDCAGKHRGLGVHLSFVRSTTMDLWSPEQLRHMQLTKTAIGSRADTDSAQATQTREELLAEFCGTQTLMFGTHFARPTVGTVVPYDGKYKLDTAAAEAVVVPRAVGARL